MPKLEERITTIVGNLSLTQDDFNLLGDTFDDVQAKNRDITSLLEEGELDTVVDEFDEVSRYIDRVLSMLDRYDSGKSNSLKKIEMKHSYLEEAIESLSVQGVNVSQLGDKVEEADEKIEDAVESLTNDDDDETTGTLIDEAEDLVEEVDDTIDELKKKPKSNNGKKGNDEKPSGNEGGNSNPSSSNEPSNDDKPSGNEGGNSNPSSNNKSSKGNRKNDLEEPKP